MFQFSYRIAFLSTFLFMREANWIGPKVMTYVNSLTLCTFIWLVKSSYEYDVKPYIHCIYTRILECWIIGQKRGAVALNRLFHGTLQFFSAVSSVTSALEVMKCVGCTQEVGRVSDHIEIAILTSTINIPVQVEYVDCSDATQLWVTSYRLNDCEVVNPHHVL